MPLVSTPLSTQSISHFIQGMCALSLLLQRLLPQHTRWLQSWLQTKLLMAWPLEYLKVFHPLNAPRYTALLCVFTSSTEVNNLGNKFKRRHNIVYSQVVNDLTSMQDKALIQTVVLLEMTRLKSSLVKHRTHHPHCLEQSDRVLIW